MDLVLLRLHVEIVQLNISKHTHSDAMGLCLRCPLGVIQSHLILALERSGIPLVTICYIYLTDILTVPPRRPHRKSKDCALNLTSSLPRESLLSLPATEQD